MSDKGIIASVAVVTFVLFVIAVIQYRIGDLEIRMRSLEQRTQGLPPPATPASR